MSTVEYILVNGDFEVHKPGCADIKRAIKQRKTDQDEPLSADYATQTEAVLDLWCDIIGDNYDQDEFAAKVEAGDTEALEYLSTLYGATKFFPCTAKLLKTDEQAAKADAPHETAASKPAKAKDKALAKGENVLLRPATKTVAGYVAWLRDQLTAAEWAALAKDPVRLAEVSLQNYGRYQASKKA